MLFSRQLLVLSTLALTALTSPTPSEPTNVDTIADWDLFHRLIDNVPESSIHSILHSLAPKFKHGVFSKDRSAIEQVHSENPILATSLIQLLKRANTTTTAVAPVNSASASSSLASVESSLASVASSLSSAKTSASSAKSSLSSAENSQSTTISSAQSSVTSIQVAQNSQQASLTSAQGSLSSQLAASSAYTASTKPAPTSLALAPTTPKSATPVSTLPGAVVFSSSGGGEVTVASSTAFVTYSRESSEILSTYTLPNGQLTTATSVVIVNAPVTTGVATAAANDGSAASGSASAGLQSGAARASGQYMKEFALMLGGAAVVAMAL